MDVNFLGGYRCRTHDLTNDQQTNAPSLRNKYMPNMHPCSNPGKSFIENESVGLVRKPEGESGSNAQDFDC